MSARRGRDGMADGVLILQGIRGRRTSSLPQKAPPPWTPKSASYSSFNTISCNPFDPAYQFIEDQSAEPLPTTAPPKVRHRAIGDSQTPSKTGRGLVNRDHRTIEQRHPYRRHRASRSAKSPGGTSRPREYPRLLPTEIDLAAEALPFVCGPSSCALASAVPPEQDSSISFRQDESNRTSSASLALDILTYELLESHRRDSHRGSHVSEQPEDLDRSSVDEAKGARLGREDSPRFPDPQRTFAEYNHPPPATVFEASRGGDDMAAQPRVSGDARRYTSSNRFAENRPPAYSILCRNGPGCKKRQEGTCNYNHDFSQLPPTTNGFNMSKKSLNVESPAFTPKPSNVQPVNPQPQKAFGISPKAAAAAAFTPRGSGSVTPADTSRHSKQGSGDFVPQQAFQPPQQFTEFVPQNFQPQQQVDNQLSSQLSAFGTDVFLQQPALSGFDASQQVAINPYTQQVSAQPYFQDAASFKHPLNYHLYASIGPHRENLMAYQRSTSDFFIPDNIREDLQRKSEAALQTFANSTLPQSIEYFHSLVALDTSTQRGPSTFGYPSHVYKATSSKDGHHYVLRRIEGFRLTDADAINALKAWKRISCGSIVSVHDAFTTRLFGDSSLIVVTDYHPLSQTLAEKHFAMPRHAASTRSAGQIVPEHDIWGYIVQLANALKAIHGTGLAARTLQASKVLLTAKNRLRLNGCGVLDVTQYDQQNSVSELQQVDLQNLGQLVLAIAVRNPTAHQNVAKSLEQVSRTYTERLRACLSWLLSPQDHTAGEGSQQASEHNISTLLTSIADKIMATFDSTLHQTDEATSNLMRELENGRLVRLLAKLNVILERPESTPPSATAHPQNFNQPSSAWSETGERYYLKLFRDYVFHQVDHEGRPVLDLGHIITSLNKLDAGVEEKIQLVSRNEQDVFIMSFREVKRACEAAWSEISKASNPARR